MKPDFVEFPKIARLSRNCVITEKIDGTNASVFIREMESFETLEDFAAGGVHAAKVIAVDEVQRLVLYAGKKSSWITPTDDNFGFASWVRDHALDLFTLGPGWHRGEWWGNGIQRTYGLPKGDKRFSLFKLPKHWDKSDVLTCVSVVPTLYVGPFTTEAVENALQQLREYGSQAAPGFMQPEGVVIYHTAGNGTLFKKTIEKDEEYKGRNG